MELAKLVLQRDKIGHFLTPYTKINSKGIKNLNVRVKTIKILKENVGSKISDISWDNIFADMFPGAREVKEKINGTTSN